MSGLAHIGRAPLYRGQIIHLLEKQVAGLGVRRPSPLPSLCYWILSRSGDRRRPRVVTPARLLRAASSCWLSLVCCCCPPGSSSLPPVGAFAVQTGGVCAALCCTSLFCITLYSCVGQLLLVHLHILSCCCHIATIDAAY